MKNENNDYVNKITRKMVSSLSQIVEIQEYNLDDLTILIRDLKETEKEKLDQVGGPISLNSAGADSGIAPNSTAKVNIPSVLCSYVKFTWVEGGQSKSSKIYNFYGEAVSGDDKSFTYSDIVTALSILAQTTKDGV